MSWLGDNLDFEKFQLGDWWKELKRHPQRALIGAMDQAGTGLWNKILGKDYDPMVNAAGGPSGSTFNRADEAGIRTGPARGAHKVADTVAAVWGLAGLAGSGAMGGGAGAGGAGAGGAGGLESAGGAQEAFRGLEFAGSGGYGGAAYSGSVPNSVNLVNAGGTMSTGLGGGGAAHQYRRNYPSSMRQQRPAGSGLTMPQSQPIDTSDRQIISITQDPRTGDTVIKYRSGREERYGSGDAGIPSP